MVHCQQFCIENSARSTRETRATRVTSASVVGGEDKQDYRTDVVYLQNVAEHKSW